MSSLFKLFIICLLPAITWSQAWTLSNLLMSGTKATYHGLGYADTVALGAQKGLDECRNQFQWNRWNCPQNVFTQIFSKNNPLPATRETAFVHAIISAGIVHTVTKNCTKGQFEKCRCMGKSRRGSEASIAAAKEGFLWGGCSDDVEFGMELAKSFLDDREIGHDPKALINLHNNKVGRMAVKNTMQRICKCHGVSGSCTTQTCWMRVADFSTIGNFLKESYKRAIKMSDNPTNGNTLGRVKKGIADNLAIASLSSIAMGMNDPDSDDLMDSEEDTLTLSNSASRSHLQGEVEAIPINRLSFTEPSPDYCVPSQFMNNGTLGRTCSRKKGKGVPFDEKRSCRTLCRSCGYKVKKQKKRVVSTCNCKFQWCCHVQCDSCETEEVTFTCF